MAESNTVGGMLRQIRRACDHTLVDTSCATGYTVVRVSQVERNEVEPDAEYMAAFARAYGLELVAARYSFANREPMTAATTPDTPAADVAAVLASLFPDGPAVLSLPGDEGDE